MQTVSTNLISPQATLLKALVAPGAQIQRGDPLSADVVHWEASERTTGLLSEQQAATLSASIQSGRSLLLTLDKYPGTSPLRLGNLLSTTGWLTQARKSPLSPQYPVRVIPTVPGFFAGGLQGMALPISFDIRPMPAVERGQARYERYDLLHPAFKLPVPAHSDFWSRSLLNRDWTIRAQADDLLHAPLVVTGRYGAGRVVVVATSAAQIEGTSVAQEFWDAIVRWMREKDATARSPTGSISEFKTVLSRAKAQVSLRNSSVGELPLQIVVRTLSGDGALLADACGEQQHRLSLAAGESSSIELPVLALWGTHGRESFLDERLQVRVGVLSGDGSVLLAEQRSVTPPAPVTLKVETDNLYSVAYPFHAPGPDALESFRSRMGTFVGAYAYRPGQSVQGTLVIGNGVDNLALLAEVKDVTTPGNKSVMALHDDATGSRLGPNGDKIDAYSMWTGKAGTENVLEFNLRQDSFLSAIVIVGMSGTLGNAAHWPGQVIVEADGHEVGRSDQLDEVLASGWGRGRIQLSTCRARTLKIRFPWVAHQKQAARQDPWLGEIQVEGWAENLPPHLAERVELNLVDSHTGERRAVINTGVQVGRSESQRLPFEVKLPSDEGTRFYRLEAKMGTVLADVPLLSISPQHMLKPMTDLVPVGVAGTAFVVSRGFREVFHLATGTAEPTVGWSSADDLIWCYSRQFKPINQKIQSPAARLYASESDMRHYVTPWCSFLNGDPFIPNAAALIVKNLKPSPAWPKADIVRLSFEDSWESGPNVAVLNEWQDFVEFDQVLRATRGRGLTGRTHQQVVDEVQKDFSDEWQAWHLERYLNSVDALRQAFMAEGKTLVLYAQGAPMVAGAAGKDLSLTFRGMHDDSTWSLLDESVPLTTGRQMANPGFNPVWEMSSLVAWGFDSPTFNSWQWHSPVGTTEPSRRHLYDSAWRGTHWPGKGYGSIYTYGYTANVGIAYTMTEDDFQQWWYMQERQSLIAPEAPLGAGLVISTARSADPKHIRFTCDDPLTLEEPRLLAQSFRTLHDAGVSLPFAANAGSLGDFDGRAPLILLNLEAFSDEEVEHLKVLHQRGVRLAAFAMRASLTPAAAELFAQEGAMLLEASAVNLTRPEALDAAAKLHAGLQLPLSFPEGTVGYGFLSQGTMFIVVEDWLERARTVEVRVSKSSDAHTASACNVNDHRTLSVRDGGSVWIIELPLRSGDGILIALRERQHGS